MMRQGTLCWMLVLAPIMASADDDGPISALDAASTDSTTRVVAQADINLAANDAGSSATIEADGTITLELAIATEGEFWIGLDCESPGEALRSQLSLGKDNGLVIAAVADDSPAKSAGLVANDVVTQAKLGDKQHAITSVDQFAALIQEAKATPLELTVIRAGKTTPVTVTPAARAGIALVKGEQSGKPRAFRGGGMVFRIGDNAGKKADGDKGQQRGHHARKDGDKHQRGHGMARRHAGHRHGKHMAQHDRGGRDRHAQHGKGWQKHRGHQPRHSAQRGSGRHFGRTAMLRHGRHGGFGHRGFGRGGFAHRGFGHGGFGRGGFGHRGFGHGSHFGHRSAFSRRGAWSGGGRSEGGSRIAMFMNMMRHGHGHGSQAFTRPVQSQRSTSGIEGRLEALVTRLERLAASHGTGHPSPEARSNRPDRRPEGEQGRGPGRFGPGGQGGFRPPFGDRGAGRPAGDQPESRREAAGEGPSIDQMRGQLRQLREQQENMMKALRDLSEALEKSSRK